MILIVGGIRKKHGIPSRLHGMKSIVKFLIGQRRFHVMSMLIISQRTRRMFIVSINQNVVDKMGSLISIPMQDIIFVHHRINITAVIDRAFDTIDNGKAPMLRIVASDDIVDVNTRPAVK